MEREHFLCALQCVMARLSLKVVVREFNGHVGESQIDVFSVVPSFLPPSFWPFPCLSLNYSRSLHRSPSILLLLLLLSASPALSR